MPDGGVVLHLIDGYGRGGAQQRYFNDLRYLGAPFEHRAYAVFGDPADAPPSVVAERPLYSLGLRTLSDLPSGLSRLITILRADRSIRLIHTQLFSADTIGRIAGRLCRRPIVSTVQSAIYEPDSGLYSGWRHTADRVTARFATEVIAVSEFVRHSVHQRLGLPLDKISVIPNAVDADTVQSDPGRRLSVRLALGLAPETFAWITVGRLHTAKGFAYLLDAFAQLVSTRPATVLLIVGGGPLLRELQERAADLAVADRVRFLGEQDDVLALLDAADGFVFPSLSEGLPVAVLEAMAMEKACVLSRIGPHEEIVEHGTSGVLVAVRDAVSLASGMSQVQGDQVFRQRLGAQARAEVARRFDARACALQLHRLYEGLLSTDH